MFRDKREQLVRSQVITLTARRRAYQLTRTTTFTPLHGRADDRERDWPPPPHARKASRASSPSSDGMRRWCRLPLRLGGWLVLATLALAASFTEATDARVSGHENTVEEHATPPPMSVAERMLASSREPTDSIVGIRSMTPQSVAKGPSECTSRPDSSIVMYGVRMSRAFCTEGVCGSSPRSAILDSSSSRDTRSTSPRS